MSLDCVDHGKTKALDRFGYARKWYDGRLQYLHRVVYATTHGINLADMQRKVVRHTCDNPRCINPEHLVLGAQQDNMDDMVRRRRQAVGERAARHILTSDEVISIRKAYIPRHPQYGAKALAALYGVSETQIGNIIHNRQRRLG